MLTKHYTYDPNGGELVIDVGHEPILVMVKPEGSTNQQATFWDKWDWCGRAGATIGVASYRDAIAVEGTKVIIGSAVQVNTAATTKAHLVVWCDDGMNDVGSAHWMGNLLDNRVISYDIQKQILCAIVKRDSNRVGVGMMNGAPCVRLDTSVVVTDCIKSLGVGQMTIGTNLFVNELDGPGGLGEGIEAWTWFESEDAAVRTWTFSAAGQVVATVPFDFEVAIIWRTSGTGGALRLKTSDMAGYDAAPGSAAAMQTNEFAISGRTLIAGSGGFNVAAATYSGIFFKAKNPEPARYYPPAIHVKSKRAVYLPGRGVASGINCGTSDTKLRLAGPQTIAFFGIVFPDLQSFQEGPLIIRGDGAYNTVGGYDWGIDTYRRDGTTLQWAGPQFCPAVSNRLTNGPECRDIWNTGILVPTGVPFLCVLDHQGSGKWEFDLNGRLAKQRELDLTAQPAVGNFPAPNIDSAAGKPTVIGARSSSGTLSNPQRMLFLSAAVWSQSLTRDEKVAVYENMALGSSVALPSTGLAAMWDARYAGGTLIPSLVDSGDDGTIVEGQVITL